MTTKKDINEKSKLEFIKVFEDLLKEYSLKKFINMISIFERMNTNTKKYCCDIFCKKEYNNKFYWQLYKFINYVKYNIDPKLFNELYIHYLFHMIYRECYSIKTNLVEDITLEFILDKLDGFIKRDILSEYLIDIFKHYNNNNIYNIYLPLLSLYNINNDPKYYDIIINILYSSFYNINNNNIFLIKTYIDEYFKVNNFNIIYNLETINNLDEMNNYLNTVKNIINDKYYIILNKIDIYYRSKDFKYNIHIINYHNFINDSSLLYINILKILPEFINIINECIINIINI